MLEKLKKYKLYILIAVIFFFANLPAFLLSYGFTDDYSFLLHYSNQDDESLRQMFFSIGRPLTHFLLNTTFSKLTLISDLRLVRLIGYFGIIIYGIVLAIIMEKKGLSKFEKTFLMIGLLFIPSINLYIAWTQYFVAGYSLFLSSLSALVLLTNDKPHSSLRNAIISVILLVLASFIHQSPAMQFWPVTYLLLFYDEPKIDKPKIKKLLISLVVWGVSMFSSFLLMKLYQSYSGIEMSRTELVEDYSMKLVWFVSEVIPRSLNLYSFTLPYEPPFLLIPLLLVILFSIGLFIHFHKDYRLLGIFITLLFTIMSYFPNLIVNENWASYRTQISLTSLAIIIFSISLKALFHRLSVKPQILMYSISLVFIFLYARTQLLFITYPQAAEISHLKYRLTVVLSDNNYNIDNLIVIHSSWQNSLERSYYDEFGLPSTYPEWTIEPMIRLLLREFDNQPTIEKITIIESNELDKFESNSVLDLSEIQFLKIKK